MHRVGQDAKLTAEMLDHALETQTDAKHRQPPRDRGSQRAGDIEVTGLARTGGEDDQIRAKGV